MTFNKIREMVYEPFKKVYKKQLNRQGAPVKHPEGARFNGVNKERPRLNTQRVPSLTG